ncbi:MAG: peptidase [Bacteroidota bacterium]
MYRILALISLYLCSYLPLVAQQLHYTVNLNDRTNDTFKVTLEVDQLKADNNIYQFAATAPGTYQVMDIGRFVKNFKAFDTKGKEIKTEQITKNQWQLTTPEKIKKISYEIAETWDTPVEENDIYMMCGSSLEDDHVLINGQTVFGYPQGMQDAPLKITLSYPKRWQVGTALNKDPQGYYVAKDYDFVVDSPILLGRLSKATTEIKGCEVEIYTYSKTDKITSEQLLTAMSDMLKAAGEFLVALPVKRYTFLYHFEDKSAGAWEHSYSSEYVYKEEEWNEKLAKSITSTAAHEFFHIVTPLNIHSEIVKDFNFVTPTPSQHLWLYEGTTEWASDMMQLRGGLLSIDDFLKELAYKVIVDEKYFDKSYSLTQLSLTSYTKAGQKQYANIYFRGALVAGLLDIRLLELSNGERGLREVVNELARAYGAENAFPEERFFQVFTEMTYPEIMDFFNKYVQEAQPLPYKEYYEKLGIIYNPISEQQQKPSFTLDPNASTQQKQLRAIWMKNLQ